MERILQFFLLGGGDLDASKEYNFIPSQILLLPMGQLQNIMFSDDTFCDTKFYDILFYMFKKFQFYVVHELKTDCVLFADQLLLLWL